MKKWIIAFMVLGLNGCLNNSKEIEDSLKLDNMVSKTIKEIEEKLVFSVETLENYQHNPRSIDELGKLTTVHSTDWTSGFYPGCLWLIYEFSQNENLLKAARQHTAILEQEKANGNTHDMGFKMFCSFGHGYRVTGDKKYREILMESAETLITRYNPVTQCIRSWDHHKNVWQFPVIIDNMMNLELLLWAFQESNDSTFYNIAISHSNTTLKNHFRQDYSSFHVVDFDTTSGNIRKKNTHQGFSDASSWARGQAWGLYGFTMMYRETRQKEYLFQAEQIANYILSHKNLPEDKIPYWDFDAPGIPDEPRDASAAAITCSALLELSKFSENYNADFLLAAEQILQSLCSDRYMAADTSDHPFILEHSTGNFPKNSEIDVPIIYADYYFIEALLRYNYFIVPEK